jgi:hypothetical protein
MRKRRIFFPSAVAIIILLVCVMVVNACRKRRDWSCNEEPTHCLRVVEQATGRPVEGASVYLVSKTNSSVPVAAYNLTTDVYGRVEWDCAWAITHVCAEAGDGYWDACGSGYSIQDDFLADNYYELKPKAWVQVNVVDTIPLNPELRIIAFSDYTDTFQSEGLIPGGYYGILGVVGGVNSTLRMKRFDYSGNYISGELLEVIAAPGDTVEVTYSY